MAERTSVAQQQEFYRRHQADQSYRAIAEQMGVSPECVRYWCRRQRDGGDCQTRYACRSPGLLSRFDAKVRYVILRLRLKHPRWGPSRIRLGLTKRPSLKGLPLPSETQIGRYLHQWPRFRHQRSARPVRERPRPPPKSINAGNWTSRWALLCKMVVRSICTRCETRWEPPV